MNESYAPGYIDATQRIPEGPASESDLLAAVLQEPARMADALAAGVTLESFLLPKPRQLWPVMQQIFTATGGIEPGALLDELRRRNLLDADMEQFIHEVITGLPMRSQFDSALARVIDAGRRRAALAAAANIQAKLEAGQTLADVALLANELAAAVSTGTPKPRSILDVSRNVAALLAHPKPMAEPIIDGGLRRGEVGLWVGATKTAKSWAMLHWHIAIATGGRCFGYSCRRGPSLLIDLELTENTNAHRLKRVAELYGNVDLGSVELACFRESPITIDGLILMLQQVAPQRFDLITIDPIFKLLPENADENSNAFVASFFARLIAAATKLDCAVLCVHHTSKGPQSGKAVSDLGAGAGAQSRAVDWHCGLRAHTKLDCVSLHTICRSFPPTEPSVWRLAPPEILPMPELDPDDLRPPSPRKIKTSETQPEKPPKPTWLDVAKLANGDGHTAAWFSSRIKLGERTTKHLLDEAVEQKALYFWEPKGPRYPKRWASNPMPLTG